MKFLLVLAVVVGVAYCESCNSTDTTSCAHETCATNYVPTCVTDICTCNMKKTQMCSQVGDCDSANYWQSHHCGHHFRKCVNGDCVCDKPQHHG